MKKLLVFAALLLCGGQGAQAQDNVVTLDAGQTASVRIDPRGGAAAAPGGVAALSDFDRVAVQVLTGLPVEAASGPNAAILNSKEQNLPPAPPIAAGAVRILFVRLANGNALLVLENGYEQALVYRARIHRRGEVHPTDVCTVMPSRRGYEHWEDPVDRIELSAFRLEPWQDGQAIRCE